MARGPAVRTEAIVLDQTKLGEADLILTLLAEDGTMPRAVAKGARKPGGRLARLSELYSRVDVVLSPGKSLWVLTDGRRLFPPARLEGDVVPLSAAAAIAGVVRAASAEDEADPYVFALTLRALEVVGECTSFASTELVVAATVLKLLAHLGWQPALEECVGCGSPEVAALSVSAGGALCEACADILEGEIGEDERALRPEPVHARGFAWLKALLSVRLDELARSPIDDAMAHWLLGFTCRWASYYLEIRLKALDFLLEL